MTQRPLRIAILALSGLLGASGATALGFGSMPESIVFGQPLDLVIPLQLEPGGSVPPKCLNADVSLGEQRVPAAALQLSIERAGDGSSRLRVRSAAAVLEPLVTVQVSLGCDSVVSRQFVVFADPPASRTDAVPLRVSEPARTAAAPVATRTALAPPPAQRPDAKKPRTQSRTRAQPAPAASDVGLPGNAPAARPRSAALRSAQRTTPRLKLEEPEALLQAATLAVAAQDAAVASAERAASAAQAAASAAQDRLLAMQTELQNLRAEAAAARVSMQHMRVQLASAGDESRGSWLLAAAMLALAALAAWLALRLRALRRERQALWWQMTQAAQTFQGQSASAEPAQAQAIPDPASTDAALATAVRDRIAASSAADAPRLADAADAFDLVQPQPKHALGVDELIDLEQQAEFFVVLGQEESAVDLLMAHLRGTGGVSPLPYLKLLEIFRRRQDREAYERLRERFNLRFNAVAPDWADDPQRGRELQDYPRVVAALQAAWPQPLDAMAELENLLFRKRRGELFELPAYRDVLSLYAVARDLHRHVDRDTVDVDLLLPLGVLHDGESTAPLSIVDRLDDAGSAAESRTAQQPTAPIDLDLSEPLPAADSRAAALAEVGAVLRGAA